MAFWSKLGKGLLKVGKVAAPIALGMTGVGLPAAMAVSGGLNALDKKVSGGSWKSALGAGALGAGMAAGSAGLGKLGGFAGKLGSKLGSKAPYTMGANGIPSLNVQAGLPAGMENVGRVAMGRGVAPSMGGFMGAMQKIGAGARTAQDVMGAVGAARGAFGGGGYRTPPFNPGQAGIMGGMGAPYGRGRAMPRMDQRAPNLAHPLMRGRIDAMMSQPWRTAPFNPNTQYPIYGNMEQGSGVGPSPEMMQQFAY